MNTKMFDIMTELNLDNGTNYKLDILKENQDNIFLQRLLKMTYDKVSYTF
jgi:hypothetical protein